MIAKGYIQNLVFVTLFIGEASLAAEAQMHIDGTNLPLMGVGLYQNLGEDIYLGALYGTANDTELSVSNIPKMQIRILTESLSPRRFTRLWLDAIALNSEREERNQQSETIMAFGDMLTLDLVKNDRIDFDYMAARDLVVFSLNGVIYGELPGAGFYDLLLQSWIGPTPPSNQFKAGLMNKLEAAERSSLVEKHADLRVGVDRIQQVREQIEFLDFRKRDEQVRLAELERVRAMEESEARDNLLAQRGARLKDVREQLTESKTLLAELEQSYLENQNRLSLQYEQMVTRWISQHMEYPSQASNRQIEGKVVLGVSIDRAGQVLQVELLESSMHQILDDAALTIVNNIEGMPPMPSKLSAFSYTVNIPFNFILD